MNQQNSEWLVRVGDKQYGPFSPTQLKQLALQGKINPETLVYKRGTSRWIHAKELKGLFDKNVTASDRQDLAADQRFRDYDPLEPSTSTATGTPPETPPGMSTGLPTDSVSSPLANSPANPNPATPVLHNPYVGGATSQLTQGQPAQGQPAQGQPAQGQPAQGQPAQGQPAQGQPAQGQSAQGQLAPGQAAQPTSGKLGIKPGNIKILGFLLFGLAAIFVLTEMLNVITLVASEVMVTQAVSIDSVEDVEDVADSMMLALSPFMCIGVVLGLASIILLFGIAGVTLTIWKDSNRDRDAKESIAIIACAITILLLTVAVWCLPMQVYMFAGLINAAAYFGILISLAILLNRWQNIRQRFVLKNVFWIAGGMALGSFAATFAIQIMLFYSIQTVSILERPAVPNVAFYILPTLSRLMMIGSTCVLGFVCLGLVSQRNR